MCEAQRGAARRCLRARRRCLRSSLQSDRQHRYLDLLTDPWLDLDY